MKRKIAAAIAAVMAFTSILPAVGVFGANVTRTLVDYTGGTLVMADSVWTGPGATAPAGPDEVSVGSYTVGFDNVSTAPAGLLEVNIINAPAGVRPSAAAKQSFLVTLTGANFAYPSITGTAVQGSWGTWLNSGQVSQTEDPSAPPTGISTGVVTTGGYIAPSISGVNGSTGTYTVRAELDPFNPNLMHVFYWVDASETPAPTTDYYFDNDTKITIPLSLITTGNGSVSVSVTPQGHNNIAQDSKVLSPVGRKTAASTAEVKGGTEEDILINDVVIRELTIGAFGLSGKYFYIDAPAGFAFTRVSDVTITSTQLGITSFDYWYTNAAFGNYGAAQTEFTRIIAYVNIPTTRPMISGAAISINGLVIHALGDYEVGKAYEISLSNPDGERYSHVFLKTGVDDGQMTVSGAIGLTPESVAVVKWNVAPAYGIHYEPTTAPTLYAGYRILKAATVDFYEKKPNSWWASRQTTFTLTDKDGNALDGVKFTDIYVDNSVNFATRTNGPVKYSHIVNDDVNRQPTSDLNKLAAGVFYAADNQLRLSRTEQKNVSAAANPENYDMASWKFTPFISIDLGFEDDIYLTVDSDDYRFRDTGYVEPFGRTILIAKAVKTVDINATTTEVQIGSQRIKVNDIKVTELVAGAIRKGLGLTLTVGEFGSLSTSDISFVPTSGSIAVGPDDTLLGGASLSRGGVTYSVIFDKQTANDARAVVEFKGVEIKVDRTVPYGTYELNVGGEAIRDNYTTRGDSHASNYYNANGTINTGAITTRDFFNNNGIVKEDFVKVVTLSSNNAKNNKLQISYDPSTTILVNGEAVELGDSTLNIGDHLYVPIRWIANAMGALDSDMNWNGTDKIATIHLNGDWVAFQIDSHTFTINGTKLGFSEADVSDKLIDGRNYISVRAFCDAFGIGWTTDDEARTVVLNPTGSWANSGK